MNRFKKWFALLLMISCTAIINQLIIDTKSYADINTKIKDVIEISLLFVYAALGYWGLNKTKPNNWNKKIWTYFYLTMIVFFILAAFIDWFIFSYSTKEQFRFLALKEILWSPLPFLLIAIFDKFLLKRKINVP